MSHSRNNSAGTTQSNSLSITIPNNLGTTVPSVPVGLIASATAAPTGHLAWTSVSDPGVSYLIYRFASSSGSWALLQSNVPQASFDDVYSVQPNTTYYYAIASTNAGATSGPSVSASATTPILARPSAPTIISAVAQGANQVIVTWANVLSTGQYILQRATLPNGNYATIQVLNAGTTSYADNVTAPSTVSTTYGYRIFSQVNGISSDPSVAVQVTLSIPANNTPVQSASLPTFAPTAFDDIAKIYKYTFNVSTGQGTWTLDTSLTDIDWTTRKTVILTHGWDSSFQGSTFINDFAWSYRNSGMNILAVDWLGAGSNPKLGSNPNGKSLLGDIIPDPSAAWVDALLSSTDGIAAAKPLAHKLLVAGMKPSMVALIGHSNGAGVMASLAEESFTELGTSPAHMIKELVALDAPIYTASYWTVLGAANVVAHIDNYYTPTIQSTIDHLWDTDAVPD